ncbi:MAG: PSD1 and planctomycete cytochrome C domain-containing protein [Pirellulales bacterium]|nr:PSD1 and planctomycete cytochrome C domain-containing protein [Pirellulales bacterium]
MADGVLLAADVAPTSDTEIAFRQRIAPVLEARCVGCHRGVAARADLSLDARDGLLKGGESGPAIVPGKPDESLLTEMIAGDEPSMPKGAPRLTAVEVEAIRQWIASGAAWPADLVLQDKREGGAWWSLRPIVRPKVPEICPTAVGESLVSWPRTPIDRFVLAKLVAAGLRPSAEADRATLIRRLTFDLHGLPPTPAEVAHFEADTDPLAYEHLVERLLASPRYGERWARHWLDVVHYGETHGYDKDKRRDHAWPYRDYVIRSLNDDKPYAQFVREQLAGDVLDPSSAELWIATGFIAAGPWDFVGHVELAEGTVEKAKTRALDRDDMVANTMSTLASMTVHCARCHDHAFDPISQVDYYRLQAVFAGIDRGDARLPDPATDAEWDRLTQQRGEAEKRLQELDTALKSATTAELQAERDAQARSLAAIDEARAALGPRRMSYVALSHEPREIRVLERGDVEKPLHLAPPGALSCVAQLPAEFAITDVQPEGARRAALAEWLVDPRNPLTWRSIVNRVWQYHLGRGLVDTPNDFGRNGSRPTHPELLDWLAAEFRDRGGSLKSLHRLISTSAVYRQASAFDAAAAKVDSGNELLWRMNSRRLEAEEIRDTLLATSGNLDLKMGGPSFELFAFKDDHSPRYDPISPDTPEVWRRTIYRRITRSVPNPWLETLDCPDPSLSTPVRGTTITALQALALWNNEFVVQQAEHFAARLTAESNSLAGQIELACRYCFGRPLSATEQTELVNYASRHGLSAACRVLWNTNALVFVD